MHLFLFDFHVHDTQNCVIPFAGLIGICGSELCVVSSCAPAQGAVSGSVQASDRLMKELREIYRSQSYKTGERADVLHSVPDPLYRSQMGNVGVIAAV